jgi:L-seryl-tRNA(Ser) seleniumtransferase
MRVDKMTLAALEGTLLLYQDPERARREIPTLRYMDRRPEDTHRLAAALLAALQDLSGQAALAVEESAGKAGGGSLPLLDIPSHAVAVRPFQCEVGRLADLLRRAPVPVVGRVAHETLYLDCLTLEQEELEALAGSLRWALGRAAAQSNGEPDGSPDA